MQAWVSENSLNSKIFIHHLATYILGVKGLKIYTFDRLKSRLGVDRAIELLRWGKDPRNIMKDIFKIPFQSIIQLRLFFETLFSGTSGKYVKIADRMSFEDIICRYSSLPGYYIGKYK